MTAMAETRIDRRFKALEKAGRSAFVTFVTAGDPDYQTSLDIIMSLADAGADIIEIGMPFSDPMADGPAIQLSSQRALKNGQTMKKTLEMVRHFRRRDNETPLVLMGYYNPIYVYPVPAFLIDAAAAGVDGLIVVDVPAEADDELCLPARDAGLNFIRLTTPTTDDKRLAVVLANTSGFLYYVSIAGITGTAAPDAGHVKAHVSRIKQKSALPVAVGFGVRTPEQVAAIGAVSDGVVVGTAIVDCIANCLDEKGKASADTVRRVSTLVSSLAGGIRAHQTAAVD